ncbi:hypothetical protein LINPERPRIM_LOCUS28400 [Linum perenne]
MGAQEV